MRTDEEKKRNQRGEEGRQRKGRDYTPGSQSTEGRCTHFFQKEKVQRCAAPVYSMSHVTRRCTGDYI